MASFQEDATKLGIPAKPKKIVFSLLMAKTIKLFARLAKQLMKIAHLPI